MYNELCKTCGAKESAHNILHDLRNQPKADVEIEKDILRNFAGEAMPCDMFESKVPHLPSCPIVIDHPYNQSEVYCQNLQGRCQQLIDINLGLAPFP